MQAGSFLKPFAFSLQLLPSADKCFTCQWNKIILLTGTLPVSAWKIKKNLQCWQVFYLSGNEFLFFFRKIFIFRYHWQVKYLSAIKSFNHSLLVFFESDRCFTCQWPTFYVFSYCLTGVLPVSDNNWYSLTGTLPVSDYFLSIDR